MVGKHIKGRANLQDTWSAPHCVLLSCTPLASLVDLPRTSNSVRTGRNICMRSISLRRHQDTALAVARLSILRSGVFARIVRTVRRSSFPFQNRWTSSGTFLKGSNVDIASERFEIATRSNIEGPWVRLCDTQERQQESSRLIHPSMGDDVKNPKVVTREREVSSLSTKFYIPTPTTTPLHESTPVQLSYPNKSASTGRGILNREMSFLETVRS